MKLIMMLLAVFETEELLAINCGTWSAASFSFEKQLRFNHNMWPLPFYSSLNRTSADVFLLNLAFFGVVFFLVDQGVIQLFEYFNSDWGKNMDQAKKQVPFGCYNFSIQIHDFVFSSPRRILRCLWAWLAIWKPFRETTKCICVYIHWNSNLKLLQPQHYEIGRCGYSVPNTQYSLF